MVAACRNPDAAEQLHALRDEHPGRLSLVRMDITDEGSIQVGRPCPQRSDFEVKDEHYILYEHYMACEC